MNSKGKPYRTIVVDGWQVLVGRGAAENDHLTFRVAAKRDAWLHVAGGVAGSHVIVRNPDAVLVPSEVLERAAQLAAWYSKARDARRVEVHVCRVADVTKPRGAPPGRVSIKNFKKLKVTPLAPGNDQEDG